jgi:hypothetical protein
MTTYYGSYSKVNKSLPRNASDVYNLYVQTSSDLPTVIYTEELCIPTPARNNHPHSITHLSIRHPLDIRIVRIVPQHMILRRIKHAQHVLVPLAIGELEVKCLLRRDLDEVAVETGSTVADHVL